MTENPIRPLLKALANTLADAARYADEAYEAIRSGEQNRAIGCALYLEQMLPTAQALYTAALALHRQPHATRLLEAAAKAEQVLKGGAQ